MKFAILLILQSIQSAYAENHNAELIYELNASIEAIAKKHNLEKREVIEIANSYLFESPFLFACGKGGSSTLGNGKEGV